MSKAILKHCMGPFILAGRMTTRLQGGQIRDEMRRLLSNKASSADVRKALGLSKSSYYRHVSIIREEDQTWLKEMALQDFVSEYRLAHDGLVSLERKLLTLADNAKNDRDRIEAIRLCEQVELDRITLLAEGPTALAVRGKAKKAEHDQKAEVSKAA